MIISNNRKKSFRPKILCFISHYLPGFKSGGPVKSISNLVSHLGNDFDFRIVTSDRDVMDTKSYPSIKVNSWNKVGTSKVYYASKSRLTFNFILKIIKTTNHDILYLNSFFNFRFTTIPLIINRYFSNFYRPCVLAPRGEFSDAALEIKFFKKKNYIFFSNLLQLYKDIYWQASEKKEFKEILKNRKIKKSLVQISPDLPIRIENLKKFNFKKSKKKDGILNIIFLSRISPMKNIDFLLRVLSKVKSKINLSIYGPIDDFNYWKKCNNQIEKMPLNINIKYLGAVKPKEVYKKISSHDIFILPSRGESYGHAIIESLIASTPVMISNKTPWQKNVSKGVVVLPLNNIQIWVKEIEKWADYNNNQYLKRSLEAKKFAKSHLLNKSTVSMNKNFFLGFIN